MEFLKLAALAVGISVLVGTALGYLVKYIVEQGGTTDAIKSALEDIRQERVVMLDDFARDAYSKNRQTA
jgi:hypothetical protein